MATPDFDSFYGAVKRRAPGIPLETIRAEYERRYDQAPIFTQGPSKPDWLEATRRRGIDDELAEAEYERRYNYLGVGSDLARAVKRGVGNLASTLGGFADMAQMAWTGGRPIPEGENLGQGLMGFGQGLQQRNMPEAALAQEFLPEGGSWTDWDDWNFDVMKRPDWWIQGLGELGVSMAPSMIPAWRLGKAGHALAGTVVGSAIGGAQEGLGGTYASRLREGIPQAQAMNEGLGMTGAAAALNAPFLSRFTRNVGGGLRSRAVSGLIEGTTELAEEPTEALITGQDPIEAIRQGLPVFPLAAVSGGVMQGGSVARTQAQQERARTDIEEVRGPVDVPRETATEPYRAKAREDFAIHGVSDRDRVMKVGALRQNVGEEAAQAYDQQYQELVDQAVAARVALQRGTSQPAGPPAEGEYQVTTSAGSRINAAPQVVNTADVITSDQEQYPAELQPRDRGRAASQVQVQTIASTLDPNRLTPSPEAAYGAPLVKRVQTPQGDKFVVISGNARSMAIRQAQREIPESAEAYQAGMNERGFAMGPGQMLVGEITSDVNPQAFAVEANQADTLTMGAAETAKADAGIIDAPLLSLYEGGDIDLARNTRFVQGFLSRLPQAQRNDLVDDRGRVSQAGIRRIQGALLARAYGQVPALSRMLEATDDNTRAITGGLIDAAPYIAELSERIRAGRVAPEYDISGPIAEAAQAVSDARRTRQGVEKLLAQGDAFTQRTPLQEATVRFFGGARNRATVAAKLRKYAEDAMREGDLQQAGMFGGERMTPEQLLGAEEERLAAATRPFPAPTQNAAWRAMKRDNVLRWTEPVVSRWKDGPELVVVESFDRLPQEIQDGLVQYGAEPGAIPGVRYGDQIYLVADTIVDRSQALAFLAHEAVGHYGIERMLGVDEFAKLSQRVLRSIGKDPDITRAAQIVRPRYQAAIEQLGEEEILAPEIIAYLAQENIKHPLLDRIIARMREFLRTLGIDIKLTRRELNGLLARAASSLERSWTSRAMRGELGAHEFLPQTGQPAVTRGDDRTGELFQAQDEKDSPRNWRGVGRVGGWHIRQRGPNDYRVLQGPYGEDGPISRRFRQQAQAWEEAELLNRINPQPAIKRGDDRTGDIFAEPAGSKKLPSYGEYQAMREALRAPDEKRLKRQYKSPAQAAYWHLVSTNKGQTAEWFDKIASEAWNKAAELWGAKPPRTIAESTGLSPTRNWTRDYYRGLMNVASQAAEATRRGRAYGYPDNYLVEAKPQPAIKRGDDRTMSLFEQAPQVPQSTPDPKRATRFRTLADNMQRTIDDKRGDRLENTPKRRREAMSQRIDADHLERTQQALRGLADLHEAGQVPEALRGVTSKKEIHENLGTRMDFAGYYDIRDTGEPSRDTKTARALWSLVRGKSPEQQRQEEIKNKINAVRFMQIDGYYSTPPEVVSRLLEAADIQPGETVLEPGAGSGAILDMLPEGAEASAYEISPPLREILQAKGHELEGSDFMEADTTPRFDKVVMNPPFEQLQDIDHVRRAFSMLKPGGRLVSVMSPGPFFRNTRKAQEFRDWFEDMVGYEQDLPAGSFQASGTGVSTKLVVIDRPHWNRALLEQELGPAKKLPSRTKIQQQAVDAALERLGPTFTGSEFLNIPIAGAGRVGESGQDLGIKTPTVNTLTQLIDKGALIEIVEDPDPVHSMAGQANRKASIFDTRFKVADQLRPRVQPAIVNQGRVYDQRRPGEDIKAYMRRVIDTRPVPESLPYEPTRFFEFTPDTKMLSIADIESSKTEAENRQGGTNAPKRFLAAYDGVIPPRGPITVTRKPGGGFRVVDGNGTLTAFRNYGWDMIPAEVVDSQGKKERPLPQPVIVPLELESKFKLSQKGWTKADLFDRAEENQRDLVNALIEIVGPAQDVSWSTSMAWGKGDATMGYLNDNETIVAEIIGTRNRNIYDPGTKKKTGRIDEKARKKGGYENLRDIVRASITVEALADVQPIIDQLGERFDILAEPPRILDTGFTNLSAMVKFENGQIGELQFLPKPLKEFSSTVGHELYEIVREDKGEYTEAEKLMAWNAQREAYSRILRATDWADYFESEAGSAGIPPGISSGRRSPALFITEAYSIGTQALSRIKKASGRRPGRSRNATRSPSQFANLVDPSVIDFTPSSDSLSQVPQPAIAGQAEQIEPEQPQGPPPGNVNRGRLEAGGGSYSSRQFAYLNDQEFETLNQLMPMNEELTAFHREGSDPRSWSETEREALEMIVQDPEKAVETLATRMPGDSVNRRQMEMYGQILVQATQDTAAAAARAAQTKNPDDLVTFLSHMEKLAVLQAPYSGAMTEAGRTLNILRKAKQANLEAMNILEMVPQELIRGLPGGPTENELTLVANLAEQIADAESVGEVANQVRKLHEPGWFDKIYEYWVNSILSGPDTHAVNMLSNTLYQQVDNLAHVAGSALGGGPSLEAALARFSGGLHGLRLGAKLFRRALVTGDPQLGQGEKFVESRYREAIGGRLGSIVRTPGRFLLAEDELFKGMAYMTEASYLARMKAEQTGEPFENIMADLETGHPDIHEAAIQAAHRLTFTTEMGPAMKALNRALIKSRLGKFIAPFIRTPSNILKEAVRFTPGASRLIRQVREDLAGARGREAKAVQTGRHIVGTMFYATVGLMTAAGKMSGAGPDDPNERRLLQRTGWQPYSIKVGDKWVRYNRFEPVGMLLGLGADAVEIGQYAQGGELDKLHSLIVGSLMRNLGDKTFLSGVFDFAEAMADPDRYMGKWINRQVSSFIPNAVAQPTWKADPFVREARTLEDKIRSRIPGKRRQLNEMLDVAGEPIQQTSVPVPGVPLNISQERSDPVAEAMLRLGLFKGKPGRTVMGVKLDDDVYNDYARQVGQNRWRHLGPMVQSPQFRMLMDNQPELARYMLEKAWDQIGNDTRKAFLFRHPEILVKARNEKAKPRAIGSNYL